MADALQTFGMTVSPTNGVFVFFQHTLPICTVRRILLTWPPGCVAQVQAIIFCGGNKVYPPLNGQALEFDDYTLDIPVSNQPNSGDWGVQVANFDAIQHSLHIVYLYDYYPSLGSSPLSQPVSL